MEKVGKCVSVNKNLYKILLLLLKVIPMLTALGYLLNTLLLYIGIDAIILSYLVGMSFSTWLFVLIAAFVCKFCIYHRMFLYYILSADCINVIDSYVGIPVSDLNLLAIHFIVAGVFLFLILYFYVKCNKKPSRKNSQ